MESEDFLGLSPANDGGSIASGIQNSGNRETENKHKPSTDEVDNLPINGRLGDCNGSVGIEEERPSQEVFGTTEVDMLQITQECTEMTDTDSVIEKIDVLQQSIVENGHAVAFDVSTSSYHATDESPAVSGVKRTRMSVTVQEPSVHVVYNSLTRESLKKLKELLQKWSEWHAHHEISDCSKNALECGEETYFPALHVGGERPSMVTFWVDNQLKKVESKESSAAANDSAPLYDRGFVLGSNAIDGSTNFERLESLEASRCFNCGSYSHSLKECPKPRDNAAISSARKQHSSKKNTNSGARVQSRYYLSSPGKFDDLKPGVLGPETRECLGIGEFDPPPWLQRMREIGYPPGYLDTKQDGDSQPSGITIFDDEEIPLEREDGELPEGVEPAPPQKKISVEFPGINAPIPENADQRRWIGSTPQTPSSDTWKRYHQNSSPLSDVHRSYSQDHKRSRDHGERGVYGADNLAGSSSHGYSPRYGPYDHSPIPRSPTLSRSHSDRGWKSPLGYESSPGYGYQTPYHYSSRESPHHHSSASSSDRWDTQSAYTGNPNVSAHGRDRDRYDPHYHHSHRR